MSGGREGRVFSAKTLQCNVSTFVAYYFPHIPFLCYDLWESSIMIVVNGKFGVPKYHEVVKYE